MRALVVGNGGREHALVWGLAQTADKLFAAPGNAGITSLAECLDVDITDHEAVARIALELGIDLVVVGPEAPLVAGLADVLRERGLAVFGPSAAAARIEGSKAWAAEILAKAGAPAAVSRTFDRRDAAVEYLDELAAPYVVKADGLAAGKGVVVAVSRAEAVAAIEDALSGRFGDAGAQIVLQEHLAGEELSVFCLSDGTTVLPFGAAQDHKRAFDGDRGPNTGGMGAYSPVPHLDVTARAVREIFEPVIATMAREGVPFQGVLYGGLMVTADGPKVFEFNCRFGDPEAQVLLPRFDGDLAALLLASANGALADVSAPAWRAGACVSVVVASGGYPGAYETGKKISGLAAAGAQDDIVVFHSGTAMREGEVVTAGGRVLAVSALGADIARARERAYEAVDLIDFEGKQYRSDIASKAGGLR